MSKLTNKHKNKHKNKNKNNRNKTRKKLHRLKEVDNFYYFVNKDWFSKNVISKTSNIKNAFSILQDKVDKELHLVLTNHIFKEKSLEAKHCKNIYDSVLTFNNALTEKQIYLFIEQINNYRKMECGDGLYKFLAWAKLNGISSPISLHMINDNQHHGRYILSLGEGGLSFSLKETYTDPKKKRLITAYTQFIKETFAIIFGPNNTYCAEDVIDIERELSKKIYTQEENGDLNKTNMKYTSSQIKHRCDFDFYKFITLFGIKINKNSYKTNVENPEYIKHTSKLMLKEWTTNKWNSFWVFRLLVFASGFHSELNKYFFSFFSLRLNGILQMRPRCDYAISFVANIMNSTLSKKYIQYYKNEKQKVFVTELTNKIKRVFKERITRSKWLTDKTKELALHKVDSMSCAIGYRDKYIADPSCDFSATDAISNFIQFVKWDNEYVVEHLHKKMPDKSYWLRTNEDSVFNVNAYYNRAINEMIIPNAILQAPYVCLDKNMAYNLASIGFIIAHEIIHGFDKLGCQFNGEGEIHDWWSKEDSDNYKKLQEEIIEQYETVSKRDNIKLNGDLTLSENIADTSALQIIEDVLEDYLVERDIFGLEQDKHFKEMYYNYAAQWRTLMTISRMKHLTALDGHSLTNYRVNCTLIRSERFRRIFNIQPGDGMYYNKPMSIIW